MKTVHIIGAGLAGSDAAWYLANKNINVKLYEMRPIKTTEAHKTNQFAELVCSNSLRSNVPFQAVGELKNEMRLLDSLIIKAAETHQVPAGSALAVDRDLFSQFITDKLKNHPNIEVINEEVKTLPDGPTIIASGPLTTSPLLDALKPIIGEQLHFYDAAAPVIDTDSINMDICYKKSRYDKGDADYINCPMTKEEYEAFYQELINGKTTDIKEFELKVFEGCMPLEVMASRGKETLTFGPLKPVGLGRENERPYAVVQLRQDNVSASMYNLVGFQTHLTFPEQKRIFRMIPGLENAEFHRLGVMHRNTFIKSPLILNEFFQVKDKPDLFIAGQITGVEGYVESAASGLMAAFHLERYLNDLPCISFPRTTMFGALSHYISNAAPNDFQPMHVNYGIIPPLDIKHKKKERKSLMSERALNAFKAYLEAHHDE